MGPGAPTPFSWGVAVNVTEAAYRFVSGRYMLSGELRLGRGELMDRIERAEGGPGAAARSLGVTQRTWQRWRSGEVRRLKPANAASLRLAVRRLRLSPGRERRLRAAGLAGHAPSFTVRGWLIVSSDERYREDAEKGKGVPIGSYISEEVDRIGPVVDAFLRGDDDGMTEAFQAALDDYVAGEWTDIDLVTF